MSVERVVIVLIMVIALSGCRKRTNQGPVDTGNTDSVKTDIRMWVTNPAGSAFFQGSNLSILFAAGDGSEPAITVDTATTYQTIDGFGNCLTGGSATLIHGLSQANRTSLLQELFATDNFNIGISYLRISIGSSDLNDHTFTYDDVSIGHTDTNLINFDLGPDTIDLIPVLKEILIINPEIKILGSPWSAPAWMKTNSDLKGGSLQPDYYAAYAKYFVRYIQEMKAKGIDIDAITVQNEPLNAYNNPSMLMTAAEQTVFIKQNLGPAFRDAGITTKIIAYDHNADHTDYPLAIYGDNDAARFVDGAAFHLYAGDINSLSQLHNLYPGKNLYFTEQWVGGPGDFTGDISWHVENLIIGATRNWCRNVLEWNMASDPSYDPHTIGGCTTCLGTITVNGSIIKRNPAYYILAHSAKFVRPGSVRVSSNMIDQLPNVAFRTPTGKKVLIVLNKSTDFKSFTIRFNGKNAKVSLPQKSVGTFTW